MSLKCPACADRLLQAIKAGELELDLCRSCAGLWFDSGELASFLGIPTLVEEFLERWHDRQPATFGFRPLPRACPRCLCGLAEVVAAQVVLDLCQQCQGIWFDEGELETVVSRFRQGIKVGDQRILNQLEVGLARVDESLFEPDVRDTLKAVYWFFAEV
ncbi:MAG: zf-TFIIB domain-containing protein [Candidatus Eremiobacteraeota bacterium]|nr:zf-TFIIB domain-containing protein [Candidatus Eremiobacteraeota bacterium]